MKHLKIAFIGLKGIPARWGGIEKFVEETGKRLSMKGHDVTVFGSRWYCREYPDQFYAGMRIKRMPVIPHRLTDALSNAALSSLLALFASYDVVHFHAAISYLFVPMLKRAGKSVIVTPHGMESLWDNPKYGRISRWAAKNAFLTGIRAADCVTTVAAHVQERMREKYGVDAIVTPAGVDRSTPLPPRIISTRYGLQGNDYLLFLGRIDPIKRIEWVLEAKDSVPGNVKLVIAGGAQDPSTLRYLQQLMHTFSDKRCIFTGAVTGDEKTELLSNCLACISASQNEGLPIALIEAISFGKCCIASDIPAHAEMIDDGKTGFLFKWDQKADLFRVLRSAIQLKESDLHGMGTHGKEKIEATYDWDTTANRLEELYSTCNGLRGTGFLRR